MMMIFTNIMQFILRLLTLAVLLYPLGVRAVEQEGTARDKISQHGFLKHLDIPLYEGFKELKEDSILFDSEFGRIIETKAAGIASLYRVMDFYNLLLPKLGWKPVGEILNFKGRDCHKVKCVQKWQRDQEALGLTIIVKNNLSKADKRAFIIRYSLKPIEN